MKTRICNKCDTEYPIEDFDKHKQSLEGRRRDCKHCRNDLRRKRFHSVKHTDTAKNKKKNDRLKWKYGISLEQFGEMYNRQKGLCAVCKEKSDRILCVDHDHNTGIVRALVCDRCNRTMGACNDDPEVLMLCAEYLESF